jgi:hypothetical protein
MIHNLLICLCAVLFSLNLFSCGDSNDNSETSASVTPGALYLAKAEGMGSDSRTGYQYNEEPNDVVMQRNEMANDEEMTSFHLGDIKASRDFYFILKNVGDTPITNISIETDNPSFEVSPSAISILEPDDEAPVMQIICVSAIHGKPLNGIGYTGLMNMGENSGVLLIQGKTTTGDGAEMEVIHTAGIGVNALVMDLEAKSEVSQIPFGSPDMHMNTSLGSLGWLPIYIISGSSVIENTGNTPFDIIINGSSNTVLPDETFTIENDSPTDTVTDESDYTKVTVTIDTKNVICNHEKFSIGDDGKVYFCIWMY